VNRKNGSLKRLDIAGNLDSIDRVLRAAAAMSSTKSNPMNAWPCASNSVVVIIDEISGNSNKNETVICGWAVSIHNCSDVFDGNV
jgi:hypothetical protein